MEPGKTVKGARLKFVKEYIRTNNGTASAMKAYNQPNKTYASIQASRLLKHPLIIKSIEEHLAEAGYNPTDSIINLQKVSRYGLANKKLATPKDTIRAEELLLKLANRLVDKKQIIKFDVSGKNIDELVSLKTKYDKLIGKT